MTKTHGYTHGGDKRGKATLKSELKMYILEYMLVLQCTRETLAKAQYDQAQDCSNYECTKYELGLSKLCIGAANFQLFCISFFFNTTLFLFFFIRPLDVKHSEKPTEQPGEQWYASLVGKVPTKYLSKGCGYGFQKRQKSTLCGHGFERKRERGTHRSVPRKQNLAKRPMQREARQKMGGR
jgi:hypothetical protein